MEILVGHMMSNIKLENILLKFAIRVLDVSNGKGNPTLGEMIDEPVNEIEALYEKAEQLRDELREDGKYSG